MSVFKKDISSFSDEQLVAQLGTRRKNEALTELHSRYAKRVLGFFRKMLGGDIEKAQDFTQELFIRILEKYAQFDPKRKFYTWMFVIASNMCKSDFRKVTPTKISEDEYELKNAATWNENSLDKLAFKAALEKAISKLSDDHQLTFVLRYMQELPLIEIAEITGVSQGTVKSRLYYSTKKVVSQIQEFNPSNDGVGHSFSTGARDII